MTERTHVLPRAPLAPELPHRYGPRVHLANNAYLASLIAQVGSPTARNPQIVEMVRAVYRHLIATAAGAELPRTVRRVETRMAAAHPEQGHFHGPLLDPDARVVIVDVMRGGIVPSQVCFEMLTSVLPDDQVRLDHLTCSRLTDAQGQVVGAELRGSKIGGSIEGAYVIVPDPMGATGSTIVETLQYLRTHFGTPARVILLPMIATPEFLRCVLDLSEDLVVYTARLDRGLSPPEVLGALPGEHWERERGLDDQAYIVPGAGGVGEVLNNSYC